MDIQTVRMYSIFLFASFQNKPVSLCMIMMIEVYMIYFDIINIELRCIIHVNLRMFTVFFFFCTGNQNNFDKALIQH